MKYPGRRRRSFGDVCSLICTRITEAFGGLWTWLPFVPYIAVGLLMYFAFCYVGERAAWPDPARLAGLEQNMRYTAWAVVIGFLLHLPWLLVDMGYQQRRLAGFLLVVLLWWPLFDIVLPGAIVYGVIRHAAQSSGDNPYTVTTVLTAAIMGLIPSLGFWLAWIYGRAQR